MRHKLFRALGTYLSRLRNARQEPLTSTIPFAKIHSFATHAAIDMPKRTRPGDPLTLRQQTIFECIVQLTRERQRPPTHFELSRALGLNGQGANLASQIRAMRKKGYLDPAQRRLALAEPSPPQVFIDGDGVRLWCPDQQLTRPAAWELGNKIKMAALKPRS